MTAIRKIMVAALATAAALPATPAMAQATRTWVSGVGDDANPCSRTAPCKTFAGAISKTASGGEINCLDPGGYGTLVIIKSITIDCTGTFGSTLSSSSNGFTINAAGINVVLRGLSINGAPPTAITGLNGIRFLQGASLTVEDVTIQNFNSTGAGNGWGMTIIPTTAAELYVQNVTIVQNGHATGGGGINIAPPTTGSLRGRLRDVRVINNQSIGMRIDTTGNTGPGTAVTVRNSEFVGSNGGGILVNTPAGTASGNLMLVNSEVANNGGTGISAVGPTGFTRVGGTTITGNLVGIAFSGGATLLSFGDNMLAGNPIGFGAPNNGTFSGADILKD